MPEPAHKRQLTFMVYATPLMTPTTALGLSIRLSMFELRETGEKNSREKWRKCISVTGSLRGQAQVRPIDKLDETCTNADDRMMLVQHCSGDRVMN